MALVRRVHTRRALSRYIEKKRGPSDNLIDETTGNLKFRDLCALSALRKEREVLFFTNFVLRNEIRAGNELAAALLLAFFDNASPWIFAIGG